MNISESAVGFAFMVSIFIHQPSFVSSFKSCSSKVVTVDLTNRILRKPARGESISWDFACQ